MQARLLLAALMLMLPCTAHAQNLPEAPQPPTQQPLAQQPSAQQLSAQQPIHDPRWDVVEDLTSGDSIELRERASGLDTQCILEYVNNVGLACNIIGPNGQMRRVVFPHDAVSRVWAMRMTRETHGRRILIATAIGAAIGAILASGDGGGVDLLGILLGASFAGGIATANDQILPRYVPRRHLIYTAP